MKTPDEIKKGLIEPELFCSHYEYSGEPNGCNRPNGSCQAFDNADDAHRLIQQLESNWQQVSKALYNKENATLEEVLRVIDQVTTRTFALPARSGKTLAAQRIYELEKELATVKRERDAALFDLSQRVDACAVCVHGRFHKNDCRDLYEVYGCKFEWRGVCQGNTEVQEDA